MPSLRKTLVLSTTVTLMTFFLIMSSLLFFTIKRVGEHQRFYHLLHDAEALGEAVELSGDTGIAIDERLVERVYKQAGSGHYYTIYRNNRSPLASPSLENETLAQHVQSEPWLLGVDKVSIKGHEAIVVEHRFDLNGNAIDVVIAEEIDDLISETRENVLFAALCSLPLLLAIVGFQKRAISRAFRPFDDVRQQVELIEAGRSKRIEKNDLDELVPLVNQINHLVEKTGKRLERSRNALGNLAHAVKTPLAALVNEINTTGVPDGARGRMERNAQSIREKIEHELKKARISGPGVADRINIKSEIEDLAGVLRMIYQDKNLLITLSVEEVTCRLDRQDILELVGNVCENACKWAKSKVDVKVSRSKAFDLIEIVVEDDGPGCDDETLNILGTSRGLRLDEGVPGYGIGLSVCREIVEEYQGKLLFGRSAMLGGLSVVCTLSAKEGGCSGDAANGGTYPS